MIDSGRRVREGTAGTGCERYFLRLFVAGDESKSVIAKENLEKLCEDHLEGRYELEIVNVLEDFSAALENNVLVTPTLILVEPSPPITIVGTLNNTDSVLSALRLGEGNNERR